MEHNLLSVISLISGVAGAVITKKAGHHWGFIDIPNDRSSHEVPTPKGGGIGILAAFIFVAIWVKTSIGFWAPVVALSLVSFLGDKQNLSIGFRLIVQMVAAIIVLWTGINFDLSPLQSTLPMVVIIIFSLIFITGTANIYNFMDGINGIAAITGIVGFGLLAWYGSNTESSSIMKVCLALAFACLGFLPFNMPKAQVFMGDVGSILLGFVFAAMVIMLADNPAEFFALAACLFPFYADELTTMVVRIRDGERLSLPHRRHLYQLLANEMGIVHWKISLGYGVCQMFIGCSSLFMITYGFVAMLVLLSFYFIGFTMVSYLVRRYVMNEKIQ